MFFTFRSWFPDVSSTSNQGHFDCLVHSQHRKPYTNVGTSHILKACRTFHVRMCHLTFFFFLHFVEQKKDESPNSKTTVQLIKYDHSPNKSTGGFSDVSAENIPGFPDVYPLSPERASDSSNFSESVNSDISPEHDISPLFRRRPRINRAHRSRVARSEYSSPALVNALAAHGRSRSLDAKEFIDEVVKAQESRPEEESLIHVCSNLIPVVHNDTTPSSVNDSRQITRTQSFNLGESGALVDPRKKPVESRPSVNNTPELATTKDRASASPKVTRQLTSTNNRKISDASRKSSKACSSHSRSSSVCDADTSSDTSKTTVRHIGSTPSSSGIASALGTEQKLEKTGFISSGIDDSEKGNTGKDELVGTSQKNYYVTLIFMLHKVSYSADL